MSHKSSAKLSLIAALAAFLVVMIVVTDLFSRRAVEAARAVPGDADDAQTYVLAFLMMGVCVLFTTLPLLPGPRRIAGVPMRTSRLLLILALIVFLVGVGMLTNHVAGRAVVLAQTRIAALDLEHVYLILGLLLIRLSPSNNSKVTPMKRKPRRTAANPGSRGSRPLTLAMALTFLFLPPSTGYSATVQAIPSHAAYVRPVKTHYPKSCKDVIAGMSGLCVLASTTPRVKTRFFLSGVKGAPVNQPVTLNTFNRLKPGDYLLYTEGDLDQLHERRITIGPGTLNIVQTATLKFNPAGKRYFRLQHYQDDNGISGRGCSAAVIKQGVRAVLPGNYQVNLVNDRGQNQAACLSGGTTINAMAQEGQSVNVRTVAAQAIATENSYRHPNNVSSLASISRFGADIQQLGLLPKWLSFNGIHNPHYTAYDALVLSGVGIRNFIVPFKYRPKQRECGISLGEAGLTAHVLMTDCVFQGRRLTGFRVNPGSYYTLNNRHGKAAIEGNYINNPILVSGVNFMGGN